MSTPNVFADPVRAEINRNIAAYTENEGMMTIQYKYLIWNLIHSQTK
jgi:hypothetical protein